MLPGITDPGSWILGVAILCTAVACLQSQLVGLAAMIFAFMLLLLRKIPSRIFWPRFKAVNIFLLFMWLIVPFTTPGESWESWMPFSKAGVSLCLLITFKANAILCIFISFLTPLANFQLAKGLCQLHCPTAIGWIFLLMERNIRLLSRQWHILQNATKLRAFRGRANLHTYKTYGIMLGHLVLSAFDQAKSLQNAIELRGGLRRLPFSPTLTFPIADAIFILLIVFLALGLLFLNHVRIEG